jgi:hypothetical protein
MSNSIVSATYEIKPQDRRCRYWAKYIPSDIALPMPADVSGASDIPTQYLRAGDEIELFPGDFVFEGEANHHRRQCGWSYWIHDCDVNGVLHSREYKSSRVKDFLRERGEKELLRGSGDCAAMVRYVHAVRLGYCAWCQERSAS